MLTIITETAISLGLFYLAYIIFLRKLAFFGANRYYLLTAIIFSMALPHINLTPPVSVATYSLIIPEVTITGQAPAETPTRSPTPVTAAMVLLLIYIAGTILLSLRLAVRLTQLMLLVNRNITRKHRNAVIVSLNAEQAPFSFLNYIFINESLYDEEEKQKILEHELVHISQAHTFDLVLLELLTIAQWFNPVAWLYRRSMLEIHEYLADEEVIKKGTSISYYQRLLLNLQLGREYFSPASNFNKSLTINRIRMMTTIKPAAWKRAGFIVLLPSLVILVIMCTKTEDEITVNTADALAGMTEQPPALTDTTTAAPGLQVSEELREPSAFAAGSSAEAGGEGRIDLNEEQASLPRSPNSGIITNTEAEFEAFIEDQAGATPSVSPGEEPAVKSETGDIFEGTEESELPFSRFPEPPETSPEDNEVFFMVEEMPDFQGGGQDAFRRYIAENLRYPQSAAESGIEGMVFVQFVIGSDGTVQSAEVVRGVHPSLDREALRVVMSSPPWTSGRQRGEPVNVVFTFPINFVLQ
ncbi:MAG: M56 family peptidase [Marinilabiliales bacterium]|nr:MAG: M56 family peptidase [Marinilabiliales bacterium]